MSEGETSQTKDCSSVCDPQIFKTDGSASASASVSSQDTKLQVECTNCTSQCGTSGGGKKRKYRKKSNKKKNTKKYNKSKKLRKTKKKKRKMKRRQ